MEKYQTATSNDEELQVVMKYIQEGWPAQKKSCASRAMGYWNLKNSLSTTSGVVFYGSRLVIPVSLRQEVVASLHSAHQGVTKLLQRASESVFWPGLRRRLEEKCLSCEACVKVERKQPKEPLIPYPVPPFPFHTIGMDLFHLLGKDYLLVVDYLTKWPVVKSLPSDTTSKSITQCLKEVFADFGRPEVVISDNGPQFSGYDFKTFCSIRGIRHKTSSPLHPSGNGQVERAVGTIKGMMHKCLSDGRDEWLDGLTSIRNTPVADGLPSPSELLQGRYLKDSHPVEVDKYKVHAYDLEMIRQKLGDKKSVEKYYHDNHAKSEKSNIKPGQQVQFRTGTGEWKTGEIDRLVND